MRVRRLRQCRQQLLGMVAAEPGTSSNPRTLILIGFLDRCPYHVLHTANAKDFEVIYADHLLVRRKALLLLVGDLHTCG
jgi:hypothetical protein